MFNPNPNPPPAEYAPPSKPLKALRRNERGFVALACLACFELAMMSTRHLSVLETSLKRCVLLERVYFFSPRSCFADPLRSYWESTRLEQSSCACVFVLVNEEVLRSF